MMAKWCFSSGENIKVYSLIFILFTITIYILYNTHEGWFETRAKHLTLKIIPEYVSHPQFHGMNIVPHTFIKGKKDSVLMLNDLCIENISGMNTLIVYNANRNLILYLRSVHQGDNT